MQKPRKVVVVDDSETVLEVTQAVLEAGGYAVATVSSPALIPATLNREKPDLVLIDVAMPFMGGRAVVELVRRAQLTHCPLVLFSDRPEDELQRVAASCSADGYLRKTGDARALLQAVGALLAARERPAPSLTTEVVLVTNQPAVRAAVERALKDAGCRPVLLPDNGELLGELQRRRPLAVLLDLDSGTVPADALCRVIRQHPALGALPVLLLTSDDSSPQMRRIFRAGASDVLWLPLVPRQLTAKIGALCAVQQAAPERAAPAGFGTAQASVFGAVQFHAPASTQWVAAPACLPTADTMFVCTLTPEPKDTALELQLGAGGQKFPLKGLVHWSQRPTTSGEPAPAGMFVHLSELPEALARQLRRSLPAAPASSLFPRKDKP